MRESLVIKLQASSMRQFPNLSAKTADSAMHTIQVTYLFDPLCGWCYGVSPAMHALAAEPSMQLRLLPTGLFSHSGRLMDADFVVHAWQNDQRIAELTGLPFSDAYRQNVLSADGQPFDSAAMTEALTAVFLTSPEQELTVLSALQAARYQQGKNITDVAALADMLQQQGLHEAARALGSHAVRQATAERMQQAQELMRQFDVQGVPFCIARAVGDKWPALQPAKAIPSHVLFGAVDDVVGKVQRICDASIAV